MTQIQVVALLLLELALPGDSPVLTSAQIFERIEPVSFLVVAETGKPKREELSFGSAVVVGEHALVTNAHVVGTAKRVLLKQGEVYIEARVARTNTQHDLARLEVEKALPKAPAMRTSSQLKVGERVYALGNPQLLEQTFSDGMISAIRSGSKTPIQTSAPISQGSSGGGLFDEHGSLVGIITATSRKGQNLNFAVPTEWVREMLEPEDGFAVDPPEAPLPAFTDDSSSQPESNPKQPEVTPTPSRGPLPSPPATPPGIAATLVAPTTDSPLPTTGWAPIPNREEGRLYLRLLMSAACVAEVWPGPVPTQARTGDLLLLPWDATSVTARSPCGGVAEVYFGREAKPRHSDMFSRAQPVRFEFKAR